ncbi:MAG: ABC transporter substrate-binding protein [Bifidobacteriaceae bacterium]|jgi:D-methionine transport system substrate-binding protein|nr:ABC transporter substrate-binding protein [Bifidobacteriaceae bacterium]
MKNINTIEIKKVLTILAAVCALVISMTLAGCGSSSSSEDAEKGTESNPVKIGVVGSSDPQYDVLKSELEKGGVFVEFVDFSNYTDENPATARGELDLNLFQHIDYLANHNVANDDTLVAIGATAIYPIGFYPNKSLEISSLDDIKKGDTVVIPDDETNSSRAIHLLASLELIVLDADDTEYVTTDDINLDESKVIVKSVKANTTSTMLKDPTIVGAVVNNDYVTENPDYELSDSLGNEDGDNLGYTERFINVWVTREADKDNAVYKKVVEIASASQAFKDAIIEGNGENVILVTDTSVDELNRITKEMELQYKNSDK